MCWAASLMNHERVSRPRDVSSRHVTRRWPDRRMARSVAEATEARPPVLRANRQPGPEASKDETARAGAVPRPGQGVVMTTARDIMHAGVTCIGEHETLQHAAQQMRDLD